MKQIKMKTGLSLGFAVALAFSMMLGAAGCKDDAKDDYIKFPTERPQPTAGKAQ